MNVDNKVVLITGGSSGIGKATALMFAKHGAQVVFSYRKNKSGADAVIAKAKNLESKLVAVQADVTIETDIENLFKQTIESFGKIDVLVNNVGGYVEGDEWNGDRKAWIETLDINLLSVLSLSKLAMEQMKKQKRGTIVNISSCYSVSGQADAIAYAAAKAAIVNITLSQAKEMKGWGRSNAVSPGTVRAGYWASISPEEVAKYLGDSILMDPEEIANAVVFLASDNAKMITGQNLVVDGGYTLKY